MSQQYALNHVSLNKNTCKIGFCIDWLMKMLWLEAHKNLTLHFAWEKWFSVADSLFALPL